MSPRGLVLMLLVGITYYLGARLGLTLSLVEHNVTPLWPPTGIAVAALLVLGRNYWPGVAVAALAVNLPISENVLAAAVTAVGNTLAPVVAVILLEQVGFRRELSRLRDAMAIVFLGALTAMLVSATIGAGTLALSGSIPRADFAMAWMVWWTGDAMGVLMVAPFLLSLPLFLEQERWTRSRLLEAGVIFVVVCGVATLASVTQWSLLFVVIPVIGWASLRLQLRGAAPAALIASLVVTSAATRELGPFEGGSLFEQMFTLQAFNACVALTSFFLASLVTERNRAAAALAAVADREHQIARALQRSLLPDRIPDLPAVAVAARYAPATSDVQVGGDWYDVVQLPGGLVGLAIGDVAGHGPQAAAVMGQVRMALRAFALHDPSPVSVLEGLNRLVAQMPEADMVTLIYLVFDPASGSLRFTNAGHPPPLVVDADGARFVEGGLAPPIGVTRNPQFVEASHDLLPGSTLLLYTDGLVERRGVSIQDGLDRLLREVVEAGDVDVDGLCEHLLAGLSELELVADDIALLVVRPMSLAGTPLRLTVPAEARMLAHVRGTLRRWLRESGVPSDDEEEILLAAGEASSNVVQHAYAAVPGELVLFGEINDGIVRLTVRDHGTWRPAADRGGGWGLSLIRSLMEDVEIDQQPGSGTTVTMKRTIEGSGAR
jgi:integral membrane sensor domain MASE1/anti-sigma regulatory factor (Ser/Thr protein kinase)